MIDWPFLTPKRCPSVMFRATILPSMGYCPQNFKIPVWDTATPCVKFHADQWSHGGENRDQTKKMKKKQ